MTYVRREYPERSWSISRHLTLEECARKYFYHYYAAHNGWERDAPSLAQEAYRLKQLTNLYLVLGDAIHRVAAESLSRVKEGRRAPTLQEMIERVRFVLNDTYLRSKSGRQRFLQSPKHNPMLHEMYYRYGPSQQLIDTIKKRMEVCVPALFHSKSFVEACSPRAVEIAHIDQLDYFEWRGTKVYAVPDLLYRRDDESWVIVDWKTGSDAEEHGDQVRVYALYAREKLGLPLERLIIRLEYLTTGQCVEAKVTEADLEATEAKMAASIHLMNSFLIDPDQNKPKGIDAFPLRDETRLCRFCNFFALCEDELAQAKRVNIAE